MMKRLLLIILAGLFLHMNQAWSQSEIILCGRLIDADSVPVKSCKIGVKNTSIATLSNNKGSFVFNSKFKSSDKITLVVNDMNYESFEKPVDFSLYNPKDDTVQVILMLSTREIETFDVYGKPKVVFSSDKVNVSDWQFVDDRLLLLTYEKRPGDQVKLILTDESQEILSSYLVQDDAQKIEKDYEGRFHLICETKSYAITLYQKQIYLLPENMEEYDKFIKPVEARTDEQVYFSNYSWHYPAFNYYAYSEADSSYKSLRYIEDKFLLDLYRAEYKYVDTRLKLEAYRMQLRTGIDKEIWAAVWNGFPNSLYYKPLYAPMFLRNDSVMVFDHYANKLFVFDAFNEPLDSININYHLGKEGDNWKKQLLMDNVTKKIYSVYAKKGNYYLTELNSKGQSLKSTELKYKYPEKIKVNNGYVYYNYRPFESQQNKFLYRQLLN